MSLPQSSPKLIRILIYILRVTNYVALLPYLASAVSASFATCVPEDLFSGFGLAGITFLIIIGYGNTLARKDPISFDGIFWVSSTVFYLVCAIVVITSSHDGIFTRLKTIGISFYETFSPHLEPYLALGAVGRLSFVAVSIWMPIAAILSLIVSLILLGQGRHKANSCHERV